MRLFLLTFFLLYGGLHYYLFVKANAALALGLGSIISLNFVMLFMVFVPLIIYFAEKHGFFSSARLLSFVGYGWMGFVFLGFSFFILIDLYRLLMAIGGLIRPFDFSPFAPSARYSFFIITFLSLVIGLYGYFEALHIRTERIIIQTPKIPPGVGRINIAQISDVHLGLIVREKRLSRIVQADISISLPHPSFLSL